MMKGIYRNGGNTVIFIKKNGYVKAIVNGSVKFYGHEKDGIFKIIDDFINAQ